MVTLSDVKEFIGTIRKEGAISTGYDAARIANDAGLHLYAMYPWRFREAATTLTLTKDQPHEDLPADLGEITAWALNGSRTHRCCARASPMRS